MDTQHNATSELSFEMRDLEVFKIPNTKTRIATVQNYFFPRLELLMHKTMDLIQQVYGVNPYEKMTFVYCPSNRKKSPRTFDSYRVHIGLTGKRSDRELQSTRWDGKPFHYHSTYLTYTIYFEGSICVELRPFRQYASPALIRAVDHLYRENYESLSTVFGLRQISHWRANQFVLLRDAFTGERDVANGTVFFSPAYYFPVSYERGLSDCILSFIALYPLLAAFIALAEGETPELPQMIEGFRTWYLASMSADGSRGENETDPDDQGIEEQEIADLPELDSYTYVRAGMWWAVLARDHWTCCSCGRSAREDGVTLEVDHIIPRSRGGTDDMNNLQTLCKKCNIGKSNKDMTDLRASASPPIPHS